MLSRQVGADSLSNALVPAVAYSSMEGFVGGVVYNRYDYRGNIEPFNNYLESKGIVSTKGFIEVEAKYERTRILGTDIRSVFDFYIHRYTADVFFGIGNNTPYSENLWDDHYYYFKSISMGGSYKMRLPVLNDSDSRLDVNVGFSSEYQVPYIKKENSSFAERMPNGSEGGWINSFDTGLIWENRDSEFNPTSGNRLELALQFAPDLISEYSLSTARLELRQYFQLFNWLTVANRLEGRHATGNVPYWKFPTLGDDETLRGYPLNRFQGNSSVSYTMELRAWILEFPDYYNLKLGGQLFTDTGRVFTEQNSFEDLFNGYKQTFGFGGAMSILNPDFILRGDIGFSENGSQIYVGVGYLF